MTYIGLGLFTFGGFEQKIIESGTNVITEKTVYSLFDIYHNKIDLYDTREIVFTQNMKDLLNFVTELVAEQQEQIPLLTTTAETSIQFWYDALTGQNSRTVYFFYDDPNHSFEDLIGFMRESKIQYFMVRYDTEIFGENLTYFNGLEELYSNGEGAVYVLR